MASVVRVRVLERATGIAGGIEPMAGVLEVSGHQLRQWLQGEDPVPPEVYFRALELINESFAKAAKPQRRPSH